MSDIELVIKIDKEEYETIKACTSFMPWTEYLIKNGTPLNDVLNKIRAEIEASKWTDKDVRIERNALASGLDKALEIIDKYRAESEVEDVRHRINY